MIGDFMDKDIVTEVVEDIEENIIISVDDSINLKLNKRRIFETLANKDYILAGLKMKLEDMIQEHLETLAKKEKMLRG